MGVAWESFFSGAYTVALLVTMIVGFVLALLLVRRKNKNTETKLLAAVVTGVAIGVGAPVLAIWLPDWARGAGILFATIPLTAAAFLHFCTVSARAGPSRRGLVEIYGLAGVTLAAALVMEGTGPPGIVYLDPSLRPVLIIPQGGGWMVVAVTVVLLGVAHGILLRGLRHRPGVSRRQGIAVAGSSLLGFVAFSGFLWPAGGAPPMPVLLLPAYPVALVYGVWRYRVMEVNLWARRGLLGGLVMGAALVAAAVIAAFLLSLAGWSDLVVALVASSVAAIVAALVLRPAGQLATRLIYPGGAMGPGAVEAWERQLAEANDHASLAELATTILSVHLGYSVTLLLTANRTEDSQNDGVGDGSSGTVLPTEIPVGRPVVVCEHGPVGRRARLVAWDDVAPGPRLAVQVMAGLVTVAADQLDRTQAKIERVRLETRECCLEEFGALAATTQDLRAVVDALAVTTKLPPEIKAEFAVCCRQMDRLLNELLLDPMVLPPPMPELEGEEAFPSPADSREVCAFPNTVLPAQVAAPGDMSGAPDRRRQKKDKRTFMPAPTPRFPK